MTINDLPDIVYHGTISIHKDSLLGGIDVSKGYESADFGQGFYTTSNYEQAVALAEDRAKTYNTKKKNRNALKAEPMVLTYKVDKKVLSGSFKSILFDSPSDDWKEFIYNNRVGIDFSVSKRYNMNGRYDFVYGCVADSNITEMVRNIKKNTIKFGDFVDSLKPLKQNDFDQLSFHTVKVVSALELADIKILEREAI